jgi:hypothetical protein
VWRGLRVLFQPAPTKLSVKLSVRHSSCVRLTIDTRITRKQHTNRCKTRTSAAGVRGKRHPHNTARVTVPSRFWVEIDRRELGRAYLNEPLDGLLALARRCPKMLLRLAREHGTPQRETQNLPVAPPNRTGRFAC